MNSDNVGKCEKELLSLDDDFESLLEEEDSCSDLKDRKNESSLNELFKQMARGDNDSSNKKEGHHPDENVEEDFEALLSGATYHSSKVDNERNLEEQKTNNTNFVGVGVLLAEDKKETTTEESEGSGYSEIFSSHIPQELSKSEEAHYPIQNAIISQVSHEKKLAVINQALKEERNSFQIEIKLKERDISELMEDVQNMKKCFRDIQADEGSINNTLTSERKEEELLSEIKILKERVKVQDIIIDEIREENRRLKNDEGGIQGAMENRNADKTKKEKDLEQRILLLERELEDQKEVHKQLKAYVGEVLSNIMMTNPQVLERK